MKVKTKFFCDLAAEVAFAGASSMQSVFCERALVKKDKLSNVVGRDQYKVNNLLDEKYEPRDVYLIVKQAHSLVGRTLPYCLFSSNCEHFVTDLRYGKAESRQVGHAVSHIVSLYYRSGYMKTPETRDCC